MKTQVLVSVYRLETSEQFESEISGLINEHLNRYDISSVKEIYVSDARMELASGYGQYKQSVSIRIDGLDFTFKEHTTDSEAYDFYKSENDFNEDFGSISEFLKGLIIGALENDDNLEKIESQIQESL